MTTTDKFLIALIFFSIALLISITLQPSTPFPHSNLTYSYAVVEIRNGSFVPDTVGVYKNATVVWINQDPTERYMFLGSDREPVLNTGDTFTMNFHEFGRYRCYCGNNVSSLGTIIVR